MADIAKMIEEIKGMTVLELNDLVKAIEAEFGVSAAAMAVAAPAGGEAKAAEEKSEFEVILKEVGANKIAVIKVVKTLTGLGLGEAKALVDSVPKSIKSGIAKAEADEIAKQLTDAGATVELK